MYVENFFSGLKTVMMINRFLPAPMSPLIRGLTLALWLLPFSFLLYYVCVGQIFSGAIALFLFALYGIVWFFCRPTGFEIVPDHLGIVFPAWRRRVPFRDVSGVHLIGSDEFKKKFGWAMRVGVGGLWGGFGWLWTSKGGLVEFYVSRVGGLVMIERHAGKNILVTPAEPEKFVSSMEGFLKR